MSRGVVVIIPTTVGLARVQQLRTDKNLHHAVMTVNFRTERASVTSDYAQFVAGDSGVVSRLTRDHRYRVKVSRDIVSGPSWKLGMLFAHLLQNSDSLSETDGPVVEPASPADLVGNAKRVIWATGDVSDELGVLPVVHIMRKLDQSLVLFQWCEDHAIRIDCYFPEQLSLDQAENDEIAARIEKLDSRFSCLSVSRLSKFPETIETGNGKRSRGIRFGSPRSRMIGAGILALGASVAVAAAVTNWQEAGKGTLPVSYTQGGSVHIEVSYEDSGKCYQNRDQRKTLSADVDFGSQNELSLPADALLCGLEWNITGLETLPAAVKITGQVRGGNGSSNTVDAYDGETRVFRESYQAKVERMIFDIPADGDRTSLTASLQIRYAAAAP
mgnify:CR=1 FL=1